jgi:hypothetical protein
MCKLDGSNSTIYTYNLITTDRNLRSSYILISYDFTNRQRHEVMSDHGILFIVIAKQTFDGNRTLGYFTCMQLSGNIAIYRI